MYKKKSLFLAFFGLPKVSRSLGIPKEGARSVKVQKIPATDPSVCFFCPNHIRQILRNPALAQRCTYPNNSNETYTFMCLGRVGRFGQC